MRSRSRHRRPIAGLILALLALVSLSLVPGAEQASAEEAPHTHGDGMFLAVDAIHGSQPAHLDASSLRHLLTCSACLAHSRTAGGTARPAASLLQPPGTQAAFRGVLGLAAGPTLRRESSRAPPTAV